MYIGAWGGVLLKALRY